MTTRFGMAACLMTAALAPAVAEDHPLVQPSRDVSVTYRVHNASARPGDAPSEIRVSFDARGDRLRVEPSGRREYMVLDRAGKRMMMVMPSERSFLELPYDPARDIRVIAGDAHFTRRGTATVAGLRCTEYDVKASRGQGAICLTDDGVTLRANGVTSDGRGGDLQATTVAYGPIPTSVFDTPPDFKRIEVPRFRLPASGSTKN
jgi:hypothetical protein